MGGFNFTLGTLERGSVGWDIDQKKLFRSTKKQKDRKYGRGARDFEDSVRKLWQIYSWCSGRSGGRSNI